MDGSVILGLDLCAAAVAAVSIANSIMVFSSRYFCSQRVMSASMAKIRSSRSLRRSSRTLTFAEDAVTPGHARVCLYWSRIREIPPLLHNR